jgi:hypothetical protein
MALFHSLRRIYQLAAVVALLAVTEAGPSIRPGSAAGENCPSDRARLGSSALTQTGTPVSGPAGASAMPRLQNFGRIPLSFEANQGQTDPQVQYLARGPGYTLFLTATEAVLALNRAGPAADSSRSPVLPSDKNASANSALAPPVEAEARGEWTVVRMQLLGSNPAAQAKGADRLPGIANYFLGNDASKWRMGIPTYMRVQYQEVYPGISLVYYGSQRQLEYDFQVGPGADPSQIRLRLAGAERLSVDDHGDLVVQADGQVLVQHKPVVYQEVAGERRSVAAAFELQGDQVSFALGGYDRSQALIIDPVLSYSTYLGGSGADGACGIAVDAAGNAYITGLAFSPDFPTANALKPRDGPNGNAFVAKLSADGSALVYSTYLGGSRTDIGFGIAVDSAGDVYLTGKTHSADFPTVNSLQPAIHSSGNAFVAKLSADGSALVYSTFLGGSTPEDRGVGIAVDAAGNAYVTGFTFSPDFPTANALQPTFSGQYGTANAFVAKLTADGSALIYSTFLSGTGGSRGSGIAVDAAGNAYVTGRTDSADFPTVNALQPVYGANANAFVAKLTVDGSALIYSTFLGGSGGDAGNGIAVDAEGNAYVTGSTGSADFPTVNALQPVYGGNGNAFVAKLTPDGSSLVYSTYLGGSGGDVGMGIAVDAAGNAFVTGATASPDFPTPNTLQPALGGPGNAFVAKLTADGSALVYSTYLGGSGDGSANPINGTYYGDISQGIAVDAAGNVYVTGQTTSADFPTANALQPVLRGNCSAFVAKISP